MSSQQVERLQAMLDRVQRNRRSSFGAPVVGPGDGKPRAQPAAAAPAAPVAHKSTPVGMSAPPPVKPVKFKPPPVDEELDFSSLPPPARPEADPAFTPAERRTRPGATPLELAVEDTLDAPTAVRAMPPAAAPAPAPAPAARGTAPGVAAPVQAAVAAMPAPVRDGAVIADPSPVVSNKPITQVLSKHAPVTAPTFGDLLKRSLSLRPR